MRFAVIIHPNHIKQARHAYPLLKRLPAGLMERFLPYLPPAIIGEITTIEGSRGDVITCPLLPFHFEHLAKKFLGQKIQSCIKKAEKQGAQIVGLEGLTASFLDEGQVHNNQTKVMLNSGLRLRTHVLLESVRIAAKKLGIKWSLAEVLLVGALGQEGQTWTTLLARESRILTLLQTRAGGELEFANRIIYETGLALKVTGNPRLAFGKADIIFLHHLPPEMSVESAWLKPGAIVCSILPGMGWGELLRSRKDVVYIDNPQLIAPPGLVGTAVLNFSKGVSPVLAETIIRVIEQNNEWFCPGREITIKQVENMAQLVQKYGFQIST